MDEKICNGCVALKYEHVGCWHTAHCTEPSRALRGESNGTLYAARFDIEASNIRIQRPVFCSGQITEAAEPPRNDTIPQSRQSRDSSLYTREPMRGNDRGVK